jgi:diguanylate cyclase (GGDEF)-like protein
MGPAPSSNGRTPAGAGAIERGFDRRTVGRVAAILIAVSSAVGLLAVRLADHRAIGPAFEIADALGIGTGLTCFLIPWDEIAPHWLHVVPALATIETAVGIRLAGAYGDVAINYYLFVAVFAAYAFPTRREVAAHVALASAASALPLLYHHPAGSRTAGQVTVGVLMLVVVAGVITALREGLEQRQRELEQLAVRDPLTGVGNYRLLAERLEYELARHRRSRMELTVMLLDLDGFKDINDTFGHLVGDQTLVDVGHALAATLRSQDTLARQGGDEFSILAPETGDGQAAGLAQRVQEAVAVATRGAVTTSVGWVTFPADAQDAGTLLALADDALREAKHIRGGGGRGHASQRDGAIEQIARIATG